MRLRAICAEWVHAHPGLWGGECVTVYQLPALAMAVPPGVQVRRAHPGDFLAMARCCGIGEVDAAIALFRARLDAGARPYGLWADGALVGSTWVMHDHNPREGLANFQLHLGATMAYLFELCLDPAHADLTPVLLAQVQQAELLVGARCFMMARTRGQSLGAVAGARALERICFLAILGFRVHAALGVHGLYLQCDVPGVHRIFHSRLTLADTCG